MITINKRMGTTIAAFFILVFFSFTETGFAGFNLSGIGSCYDENKTSDGLKQSKALPDIEGGIKQSSIYYLKTSRNVNALLRIFELQDIEGVDITELKALADRAYDNMKKALKIQLKLVKRAEDIPYRVNVINRLKALDYQGFNRMYKMNADVFESVRDYLAAGDINGILKKRAVTYQRIVNLILAVKKRTDQNKLPTLKDLWTLNESLSLSSMFGSYTSRVFRFINVDFKRFSPKEADNVR